MEKSQILGPGEIHVWMKKTRNDGAEQAQEKRSTSGRKNDKGQKPGSQGNGLENQPDTEQERSQVPLFIPKSQNRQYENR